MYLQKSCFIDFSDITPGFWKNGQTGSLSSYGRDLTDQNFKGAKHKVCKYLLIKIYRLYGSIARRTLATFSHVHLSVILVGVRSNTNTLHIDLNFDFI